MCRSMTRIAIGMRSSPAIRRRWTRRRCATSGSNCTNCRITGRARTNPTITASMRRSSRPRTTPAWAATSTCTTSGRWNRWARSRIAPANIWAPPTRPSCNIAGCCGRRSRRPPPAPSRSCSSMPRMRRASRVRRPWTASVRREAGKPSGWRSTSSGGAARHGQDRFRPRSPTRCVISRRSSDGVCGLASGGRALSFVRRHGLWSDEQKEAVTRLRNIVEEQKLEVIRLSFPDQHGVLRGKTLVAAEALASLESGCTITTTMFAKDTSHKTVFPVFTSGGGFGMREMEGAADVLMVPDPLSFRVLPWSPATGWLLCDVYFVDGRPVPFATRHLYRSVLDKLAKRGYDFVAGLEVEFHIFKLEDAKMSPEHAGQPGTPPDVSLLSHGYQYLTEQRYDQMEPVLEIIRRDVLALGLPLRSIEVEFGPSQCEFTFAPRKGLEPADTMILLRSAVKQICHRHGYHATFMCRPKLPNVFASGWHLHQSIVSRAGGENAFMTKDGGEIVSAFGRNYLAGLLKHARASAVFSTPTINGYKRYRAYSLAPDRAIWGRGNRGGMVGVLGGGGDR